MKRKMQSIILCLLLLFSFTQLQAKDVFLQLTERQLCDLEMIFNGGFAPLKGFLGEEDYHSVVSEMRLSDGSLWPMPIMFDLSTDLAGQIEENDRLMLRDREHTVLAIMTVKEKWQPNKELEAERVFGTKSVDHPAVDYLYHKMGDFYVSGPLQKVAMPHHYSFGDLRKTPTELKEMFEEKGWDKVVAFQTRNPMHRAHVELTMRAMEKTGACLLIQPIVGLTKPGDVDPFTRVACYRKVIEHYPEDSAMLSVLPLAMRMAGPKEALWHALIRKNCGATHFIVGRDHAGPGKDSNANDFYGPYDAQDLVRKHQNEIGIEMIPFQEVVYLGSEDRYVPRDEVVNEDDVMAISGTEFRRRLFNDIEIPTWFSFPEVIETLREAHPGRKRKGFCVFFTGLSGAGKSTMAQALNERLMEIQKRPIYLVDGDEFRKNVCSELGFSKKDRSVNVRRAGYVANIATKNRGVAICAFISPYQDDRNYNRELITKNGGDFIEVYLSTPLDVCETRDPKGLYHKARKGEIAQFTGISDPYEIPESPELTINTSQYSTREAVEIVIDYLKENGYL